MYASFFKKLNFHDETTPYTSGHHHNVRICINGVPTAIVEHERSSSKINVWSTLASGLHC